MGIKKHCRSTKAGQNEMHFNFYQVSACEIQSGLSLANVTQIHSIS